MIPYRKILMIVFRNQISNQLLLLRKAKNPSNKREKEPQKKQINKAVIKIKIKMGNKPRRKTKEKLNKLANKKLLKKIKTYNQTI